MNKKYNTLFWFCVVLGGIGAIFFYQKEGYYNQPSSTPTVAQTTAATENKTVVYTCPDGKSISATFHLPQDASVNIVLSDGRSFSLPHAVSADGARYANASSSIVFWNVGNSAMIQENGTTTYQNCIAPQN